MRAYVAVVEDKEGGYLAVRFPSIDALEEWEERTGVYVISTFPVGTRAEAVKASK